MRNNIKHYIISSGALLMIALIITLLVVLLTSCRQVVLRTTVYTNTGRIDTVFIDKPVASPIVYRDTCY